MNALSRTGFDWQFHFRRTVVTLWIVMAIVMVVKGAVDPLHRSVYPTFADGARHLFNGESLYSDPGYFYGPTFAILFQPFAWLPDRLGATLWSLLNVGLLFYAVARAHRELIAPRWPQLSCSWLLLLTLVGSVRSLYSGQSNSLLIALLLLGLVEIVQGRWWRAAFCLTLPIHWKVWPVALAALLVVQYPRKLCLPLVASFVALAALPLLVCSPLELLQHYDDWLTTILNRQVQAGRWGGYRDAWTLWEVLGGAVDRHYYQLVQLLGGLVVLAGCLSAQWRRCDQRLTLLGTMTAWSAWQMLLGPGSERMTLIILAPMAAWLCLMSWEQRRDRVAAGTGWLLAFVLGHGFVERALAPTTSLIAAAMPVGALLLGAVALRLLLSGQGAAILRVIKAWRVTPVALHSAKSLSIGER